MKRWFIVLADSLRLSLNSRTYRLVFLELAL